MLTAVVLVILVLTLIGTVVSSLRETLVRRELSNEVAKFVNIAGSSSLKLEEAEMLSRQNLASLTRETSRALREARREVFYIQKHVADMRCILADTALSTRSAKKLIEQLSRSESFAGRLDQAHARISAVLEAVDKPESSMPLKAA